MEEAGAAFNFSLVPGDRWGVLGTPGCGKTRFLRALAHLTRPLAGHLFWDEAEVTAGPRWLRRPGRRWQRGFVTAVLDDPYTALEPWASVRKYLRRTAFTQAAFGEHLQDVGLSPVVVGHRVRALSGVARARLALACALLSAPRVLLIDDVFTRLLPEAWGGMLASIDAVVGPTRALVIASTYAAALRTMRDILVMRQGAPVEWGPRAAVFSHPQHPYTRWLLAQRPGLGQPGAPPTSVGTPQEEPTEFTPGHWAYV